jgi:hypothetical protein
MRAAPLTPPPVGNRDYTKSSHSCVEPPIVKIAWLTGDCGAAYNFRTVIVCRGVVDGPIHRYRSQTRCCARIVPGRRWAVKDLDSSCSAVHMDRP